MHSRKSERGQGMVEYLIIVVVVAVGSLAVMKTIRTQVKGKLETVKEHIENLQKN